PLKKKGRVESPQSKPSWSRSVRQSKVPNPHQICPPLTEIQRLLREMDMSRPCAPPVVRSPQWTKVLCRITARSHCRYLLMSSRLLMTWLRMKYQGAPICG